jgi:hypothetical protein
MARRIVQEALNSADPDTHVDIMFPSSVTAGNAIAVVLLNFYNSGQMYGIDIHDNKGNGAYVLGDESWPYLQQFSSHIYYKEGIAAGGSSFTVNAAWTNSGYVYAKVYEVEDVVSSAALDAHSHRDLTNVETLTIIPADTTDACFSIAAIVVQGGITPTSTGAGWSVGDVPHIVTRFDESPITNLTESWDWTGSSAAYGCFASLKLVAAGGGGGPAASHNLLLTLGVG